ncbi:hypothetical protein [Zavarzinella formosa]|uniref:hypothetical protein n=1 Tax=Zavarzinella formosa TaxID=360055 RepID=UPI0002F483A2|nr:hypothetical protein [Zavarzinella formosa]
MQAVTQNEFLKWAAGAGIGFHPQYPDSGLLTLLPPGDHARFWVTPADPAAWAHFIASMLDGMDEWAAGYLWPRSGQWPNWGQVSSGNQGVRDVILKGAGIPDGWPGAVRFERKEESGVLAVLFASLAFGWCVDDDLFFIPDHGRQLLQTDHHDVIHVQCASEKRIRELVAHMANQGYELPAEPPDWTFKRPAWMGAVD